MYYLIGQSLSHSYSEEIHRAFGAYDYRLMELLPEELDGFFRNGDFEGLNVTIPYKERVIPYCTRLTPLAEKIGAVNTITREGNDLVGDNTDYYGALTAALRAGITFAGKKVVVLGSGGASKTVAALARDCEAREVVVVSRTGDDHYGNIARHADAEVLVNATPVGMYPASEGCPVDLSVFPRLEGLLDLVYNPLRTRLYDAAAKRGIKRAGGLYMLVSQAAIACGRFTGKTVEKSEIDRVYRQLLVDKGNIVLVGMPGAGKTTVARALGDISGKAVVDTDEEIEKKTGKKIPDLITSIGEDAFRKIERDVVRECGARAGAILATGGGAVLSDENRAPLAQNGRVYFLLRDIASLPTGNRPLSAGADLAQMYRARLPHYMKFSDKSVENNDTPAAVAARIWEDYLENFGTERPKPESDRRA